MKGRNCGFFCEKCQFTHPTDPEFIRAHPCIPIDLDDLLADKGCTISEKTRLKRKAQLLEALEAQTAQLNNLLLQKHAALKKTKQPEPKPIEAASEPKLMVLEPRGHTKCALFLLCLHVLAVGLPIDYCNKSRGMDNLETQVVNILEVATPIKIPERSESLLTLRDEASPAGLGDGSSVESVGPHETEKPREEL